MAKTNRKAPSDGKSKAVDSPKRNGSGKKTKQEQKSARDSFPIVCLGASAGGLRSLEAFLDKVPKNCPLAFVVISHTDPERASLLPEILRRRSLIPVKTVEDGMDPEPHIVYLPPSNKDLVLDKGKFHLEERKPKGGLHMPIDRFLESLSRDRGDRAGSAILSGTGTDGSHGVRLIKEAGGVVLAESESSAGHYGMPESAIETGVVDFIVEAARMPDVLIDYFENPATLQDAAGPREEQGREGIRYAKSLSQIIRVLQDATQHDFSYYKKSTLSRRIERRMSVTGSRNPAGYLEYLRGNPGEAKALFQELLIGVTEFFRDPETFAILKEKILPELFSGREGGETFRIWVAGCATGEEVYSVAMILREYMEENGIRCGIQIFGTDIDPNAIEKARQGVYFQNIAAKVSEERLKRFFSSVGDRCRVEREIREPVIFAVQDILRDPPFTQLDLLFCRNLLIYLEAEAQHRLLPVLHYSLKRKGVLVLGSSESTGPFSGFFSMVDKKHSIYRKREVPVASRPMMDFPIVLRKLEYSPGAVRPAGSNKAPEFMGIAQATERLLLRRHTPTCVIVDRSGHILHIHGRTGKFLELPAGRPDLDISTMAREGLRAPISAALRQAATAKKEIVQHGLRVKANGSFEEIDLTITPLSEPSVLKGALMILFEKSRLRSEKAGANAPAEDEGGRADRRRLELEQEIIRVREDYRSALEELETSNEELQSINEEMHSSNEELQSANEELESSREELQSLNEELNTVNNELQSKIEELSDAYASITHVLNSTQIAVIFLNNDLIVKRFTLAAADLINLIDGDIGRPITHISHNLKIDDLPGMVRKVVGSLSGIEGDVQSRDGRWYRMRIMVHRSRDNVIEGVVLTFINIDAQKEAQKELEELTKKEIEAEKRFSRCIVDTVRDSLLVLDRNYRVLSANGSFYRTFQLTESDVKAKSLFELQDRLWDSSGLRALFHRLTTENESFDGYEFEHQAPKIGKRRLLLNARFLVEDNPGSGRILLAIEDITGRARPKMEAQ